MNIRRAQPSESVATSEWVKAHHYTKRCPPRFRAVLEFIEGKDLVGAMLLGRPSARQLDADLIVELTRMYFVDEAPKNTESHALSMMRRWVRTWWPQTKLLIAYSDPSVGHEGTVYLADGWCPFGMTTHKKGYGWKSRPNRNDDPVTPKQRWVRTP
jgi:hypothetical protein